MDWFTHVGGAVLVLSLQTRHTGRDSLSGPESGLSVHLMMLASALNGPRWLVV